MWARNSYWRIDNVADDVVGSDDVVVGAAVVVAVAGFFVFVPGKTDR